MKRNQNKFLDNQQAANIPSVSKADVEKFDIISPSYNEQVSISGLFINLDNLITLHQGMYFIVKTLKFILGKAKGGKQ